MFRLELLQLSAALLRLALRFHRRNLDALLAQHVQRCHGRGKLIRIGQGGGRDAFIWAGACTKDLDNCTESEFCKTGRPLFQASFDITERLSS